MQRADYISFCHSDAFIYRLIHTVVRFADESYFVGVTKLPLLDYIYRVVGAVSIYYNVIDVAMSLVHDAGYCVMKGRCIVASSGNYSYFHAMAFC